MVAMGFEKKPTYDPIILRHATENTIFVWALSQSAASTNGPLWID
jgi:hypothetical protein